MRGVKAQGQARSIRGATGVFWILMLVLSGLFAGAGAPGAEGAASPAGEFETPALGRQDVLVVAVRGVPPSLDAHWNSTTDTRDIAWHMFEALFTFDDDYGVAPMLAEGYEVSEDARNWTIRLRRGVRFHNGDEMKAGDVVASLVRWGQVAPRGRALFETVESIGAAGDYTVEIRLSRPNGSLPAILADTLQFAAIYPEAVVARAGAGAPVEEYIGTGPFRFVATGPGGSIRLARFDGYSAREEPASGYGGRRAAHVEEIVFVPVPSPEERLRGLLEGAYDFAEDLSPDAYPVLVERLGVEPVIVRPYEWAGIIFNKASGLFADPRMREAVRASLDAGEILAAAFGDRVFYEPGHSLHAPGTVWHSDAGRSRWNRPDRVLARQILLEAGYDGRPVRWLATTDYPWMLAIAEAAKKQLAAVGIPVEIEVSDWATLVRRRADPNAWDIFVTSFPSAAHPVENPYLAGEWPGWWRSEARDRLMLEFFAASDEDEQREIWESIQALFWRELPIYPLGEIFLLRGVRSDLRMDASRPGMHFWNAVKQRAHAQRIEVTLPHVDGWMYDFAGAEEVNRRIQREATAIIADLAAVGDVFGEYEVHVDRGGVLSVTLQYSAYHQYMAHPMHVRASVTGNLHTGEVYSLADLFSGDEYVEVLSRFVKAEIEKNGAPTLAEFERIAPDQDFYLTGDALVLYFQLYELYPYAWGFPEFVIPYEAIAGILKEGGPVELVRRG